MNKPSIAYSIVNTVGVAIVLGVITHIEELKRAEERAFYDFGDSLRFLSAALPVFLVCLSVNLVWGVMAVADIRRHRGYSALVSWSIFAVVWAAILVLFRTGHLHY